MRLLAPLLVALLLGATDGESFQLDLLPKPEKGQEEKIEIDARFESTSPKEIAKKTVKGTLKRKIQALGDDGLPSKESLSLEGASVSDETSTPGQGGGLTFGGGEFTLDEAWTRTVKRENKARRAQFDALPDEYPAELSGALGDDPDALVRAILPEGEVKKSEEWEVDAEKLLLLFGPYKAKLADKSKATATLDSVKKSEARITVTAQLRYTTPADPETEERLGLEIEVRGAMDGSAPPRKQKVTITRKKGAKKEVKETLTISLTRAWAEKDEEEEAPPEKPKAKK